MSYIHDVEVGVEDLDFGVSNKTAITVLTGLTIVRSTDRIVASMRMESTIDHPVDDLLIDPIRLSVKDLVVGVGFTIYGTMDNAPANGAYKIDWIISK